jgi:hypothetical protein
MSSRLRKYFPVLKILAESTPANRKKILIKADDELIKVIIECCYNTLEGNFKFSTAKKEKNKKA